MAIKSYSDLKLKRESKNSSMKSPKQNEYETTVAILASGAVQSRVSLMSQRHAHSIQGAQSFGNVQFVFVPIVFEVNSQQGNVNQSKRKETNCHSKRANNSKMVDSGIYFTLWRNTLWMNLDGYLDVIK